MGSQPSTWPAGAPDVRPPGGDEPSGAANSRRYVVVCRGPHCRERGSLTLRSRLVGLLRGRDDVRLVGYACFGQCERGPNVAFYPEGTWFGGLDQPHDAERVIQHATGERLLDDAPLELDAYERTEHLHNIAELIATLEGSREHHARGGWKWWPFSLLRRA